MSLLVATIVEGTTEVQCVRKLLQRTWTHLLGNSDNPLIVLEPSRAQRDRLTHVSGVYLTEKVEEAFAKLAQSLLNDPEGRGLLLILIDAESDCPMELAPRLLQTARSARNDADIACVLARRMIESWFVAAASSLAGIGGLPNNLATPDDAETRNPLNWLNENIRRGKPNRSYKKTVDAKNLVAAMDLSLCHHNSRSFRKLCKELQARLPNLTVD